MKISLFSVILLLLTPWSFANSSCDVNAMVKHSFDDIRHEEEVMPVKVENLKGGLVSFSLPPANTDFNILVTFKRKNLKTGEDYDMSGIYYFDNKCILAGSMTRAVYSEGDPRIIELK